MKYENLFRIEVFGINPSRKSVFKRENMVLKYKSHDLKYKFQVLKYKFLGFSGFDQPWYDLFGERLAGGFERLFDRSCNLGADPQ